MFTAASFIGGLAQDQATLIAARALQGIGGAVLAPATLTILTTTFPEGPERARALGVWTAVAAAGASAGVLIGGLLTDLVSWRWILFVNVPVGVVAIVAAMRYLPSFDDERTHHSLDVAGALTVTGGLSALVFGIVQTETHPWASAQTLMPLVAGVVLLAAFVVIETKVARSPLVPFRIFRSRTIAAGNTFVVLLYAAMFGSFYFETLYVQRVLGYSPLVAGVAFLPITFLLAFGSQVASRTVTRWGPRPLLLIGTATAAAGLAWLAQITPGSGFASDLLGPFALCGLGMGLAITPVAVAVTGGVAREEAGLASGLLNTARQIGISVGLAILATIAAGRTTELLAGVPATPSAMASALTQWYARALDVSVLILVAAGIVVAIGIPALRREPADVVPLPEAEVEEAESA
jgi:EmrB/QacA subfamily drug resistance transporter